MREIEYVIDGAVLTCTMGTAPSQLKVSSQAGVVVNSKPMATAMDKLSVVNILPFGNCKKGAYPPLHAFSGSMGGFFRRSFSCRV